MRCTLILVALVAFLSTAYASIVTRQSLPSCATSCLENANFGNCSQTDNLCLCKSSSFVSSTTACIQSACSGQDLANAEAYSQAICKSVGVTLTNSVPTSTATSSSSAASDKSTGAALSNSVNAHILTGAGAIAFGVLALAL